MMIEKNAGSKRLKKCGNDSRPPARASVDVSLIYGYTSPVYVLAQGRGRERVFLFFSLTFLLFALHRPLLFIFLSPSS